MCLNQIPKNVRNDIRCRQKWQVEFQSRTEEPNIDPKGWKIGDSSPGPSQQRSEPTPWRGGRGRGKPLPREFKPHKHRHPMLNHPSPEGWWDDGKRPGASVLPSKFSGGGFWGGNTVGWWDFFPPFWFSGGSKTTKEVFKMVPRHVSDSPRRTQDGPRRRQDSQDGSKAHFRRPKTDPKSTKINGKLMFRAIPISVSFFVRFLIAFTDLK